MTAAVHLVEPLTPRTGATVTPHHRPSTPSHEPAPGSPRALLTLAGFVMLGVLLASISGIAEVAELVKMPKVSLPPLAAGDAPFLVPIGTIGLILAWDGLQVTAAWAMHAGRDRLAPVLLVVTAVASGAAQGWAGVLAHLKLDPNVSWGFLLFVFLIHASPAVALIGAEALVFRAAARALGHGRSTAAPSSTASHPVDDAEPAPTPPEVETERPAPAAFTAAPTPIRRSAPAPQLTKKTATATTESGPEVLVKVLAALREMGVDATDTTRDAVLVHMRKSGPAPHATKVGAALNQLREECP
jgi:hypothetical protein